MIIKWIGWTFIRGIEMIGISVLILSFVAGLTGLAGILIWYALESKEYLILTGIVVGCIFIFGLIFRGVEKLL
jgi:hypothetical protein